MSLHTRLVLAAALVLIVAASYLRSRGAEGIVAIGPEGGSTPVADVESKDPSPEPSPAILPGMPLGVVVAWMKSHTNTPPLPSDWVQCDGQKLDIPGSPYDGTIIPNLNGAGGESRRFLRGSLTSGESGGAETHLHGRMLIDRSGKRTVNVSDRTIASHLPPYCDVVWIMKVAN